MPFGDAIVPILQTGLAGLAFLLAYLSFRLIASEQKKDKPKPAVLQTARHYFYLCILLAVIVGSFPLIRLAMQRGNEEQLAACRDSFDLLSSRVERAGGREDLLQAINAHLTECAQTIELLDRAGQ